VSANESELMTFYKVRNKKTGEYYNPNKPGDRLNPTFDKEGKRYYGPRGLGNAKKAVEFCAASTNTHWCGGGDMRKQPIETEIDVFSEEIRKTGSIK